MPIRLDQRLTRLASIVDYGVVADIGCDHGKLGYYLIGTERVSKVIATDISALSLKKAEELANENGVSDLMQTRIGDGLKPINSEEVDTVIIAGLGGDVISEILIRARKEGKKFSHYVLSPNTHSEKVRKELAMQHHKIVVDDMLECAGKMYTILKTDEGESDVLDNMQILFGKFYKTCDGFRTYAKAELEKKQRIYAKNPVSIQLKSQIELLKMALENK